MTELEMKAREAWSLMARRKTIFATITGETPMDAPVALDFVQNVTGERDDAVAALVVAGANWLSEQTQPSEFGEISDGCMADARVIDLYIRSESLGMADVHLSHIRDRLTLALDPRLPGRWRMVAHEWDRWAAKAAHVIELCRKVIAAAYPIAEGRP